MNKIQYTLLRRELIAALMAVDDSIEQRTDNLRLDATLDHVSDTLQRGTCGLKEVHDLVRVAQQLHLTILDGRQQLLAVIQELNK